MRLISHRGNVTGKIHEVENSPSYIQNAIKLGYDVEIDLWVNNGELMLGHDDPQYPIDFNFLTKQNLWIHAKNIEALLYLKKNKISQYFWHQEDDYTITSNGLIWTYPGKPLTEYSICVLPELCTFDIPKNIFGICSDNIEKYK